MSLRGLEESRVRGHVRLQGPQPQLQSKLGPGTDPLQVRTAGRSPVDKHGGGEGGVTQPPVTGDLGHTRDTAGGQRSTQHQAPPSKTPKTRTPGKSQRVYFKRNSAT